MTRKGIAAEIRPAGGGVQRCREISIQVTPCAGGTQDEFVHTALGWFRLLHPRVPSPKALCVEGNPR